MSDLPERVRILESWKTGDGARGAEVRLQDVERKTTEIERNCRADLSGENAKDITDLKIWKIKTEHELEGTMTIENVDAIVEATKTKLLAALRAERNKGTEKLKAWAPYIIALCALAAAIIPEIIKK
jgi:hypothetical protein